MTSPGDGHLTVDELIENIHVINAHSLQGEEIMDAFDKLDLNKDGVIRCVIRAALRQGHLR